MPANIGGHLAFIGWCAAETPNQQVEEVVEVQTLDMTGGEGMGIIPQWMIDAAHKERPGWHVVSAWAPSGAHVCAQVAWAEDICYWVALNLNSKANANAVYVCAVDGAGRGVSTTVLVRIRCATAASLEPWENESDPRRRAESLAFHRKSRRHDKA
jgi:hypothetical protein